jgi:hypothetical protein
MPPGDVLAYRRRRNRPWRRRRGAALLQDGARQHRGPGAVHAAAVCVSGRRQSPGLSYGPFSWTRRVTKRFDAALTFYDNKLALPGLRGNDRRWLGQPPLSVNPALGAYRRGHRLEVPGRSAGGRSRLEVSLCQPAVAFQSRHFGASGQYQFGATPGLDSGGRQFRASLRSGWGAVHVHGLRGTRYRRPHSEFHLRAGGGIAAESGVCSGWGRPPFSKWTSSCPATPS